MQDYTEMLEAIVKNYETYPENWFMYKTIYAFNDAGASIKLYSDVSAVVLEASFCRSQLGGEYSYLIRVGDEDKARVPLVTQSGERDILKELFENTKMSTPQDLINHETKLIKRMLDQ